MQKIVKTIKNLIEILKIFVSLPQSYNNFVN